MSYCVPTGIPEVKRLALKLAHERLVPGRIEKFAEFGVSLVMGKRESYRFWDVDAASTRTFISTEPRISGAAPSAK